jgi:SulP family sulfate permease
MISAATAAIAVLDGDAGPRPRPAIPARGDDPDGHLQAIAGFLKLDLLMQFVSRSVITGFVNALAILIFMAQLPELINVSGGKPMRWSRWGWPSSTCCRA